MTSALDYCAKERPDNIDQVECRDQCPDYDRCLVSGYLNEIRKTCGGNDRFELIEIKDSPSKSSKHSDLPPGYPATEEEIRTVIVDECFETEDASFYDGKCQKGTARTVPIITKMKLVNEEGEAISSYLIGIRAKLKCGEISREDWDMLNYQSHRLVSFIDDISGVIYHYKTEKNAMLDEINQAWRYICEEWRISKRESNKIIKIVLDDYKKSYEKNDQKHIAVCERGGVAIQKLLEKYHISLLSKRLFDGLSERKRIGNLALILLKTGFWLQDDNGSDKDSSPECWSFTTIRNWIKKIKKNIKESEFWLTQISPQTGAMRFIWRNGRKISPPPGNKNS